MKPEYVDLIEQLIKVTNKRITDSRIVPLFSEIEESEEVDSGQDYETDSNILRGLHEVLTQSDRLPPGWEFQRTSDGFTYYVDHYTCRTTWTHPSTNPSNDPLPPDLEVRQTPDGRKYYIDHDVCITTWIHPFSKHDDELPPGWEVGNSLTGRQYYVDHNTHSTTWTRPPKPPPYIVSQTHWVPQQAPSYVHLPPSS